MLDVSTLHRIPEAKQLVFPAHVQSQHFAANHPLAVHQSRFEREVFPIDQSKPLKRRRPARVHVAFRVEQPVLRHPHRRVAESLVVAVLCLRAWRRHLQHPVRRLALLPHQIGRALFRSDAERHQHVRPDLVGAVSFFRVHQNIRGHQRPGMCFLKVADGVHDDRSLPHVLGHRLTVRARIEHVVAHGRGDGSGRGGGKRWPGRWHGAVLLDLLARLVALRVKIA